MHIHLHTHTHPMIQTSNTMKSKQGLIHRM